MNIFKIAGKFLDQPLLVAKFEQKIPYILTGSGIAYCASNKTQTDNKDRIRNSIVMGTTIVSALAAPKIANKLFKNKPDSIKEIKNKNSQLIDEFIRNNKDTSIKPILLKAKKKILSFNEVKILLKKTKHKDFVNKLIPDPENITSKEIFSEIGRLSVLGFIPVVGGILGGIAGDYLVSKDWKSKIPDKIKEGTYQYLANIFLCNIGAGAALALLERNKIKSKSARAFGMTGGIVTTGIIGGSAIANIIGNKIISPIFGEKQQKGLYKERTPEALDIGLHTDDIATVAVLSGLKWIEPALPIMYTISGYRAGVGYRNGNVNNCKQITKS